MTTRVLWVIEDDNLKGRTLVRVARQVRPDLEVVRLHSLQEWLDVVLCGCSPKPHRFDTHTLSNKATGWAGVITDWKFPHRFGEGPQVAGDRVLESLDGTGIPRVVVSGSDRPVGFVETWNTIDWLTVGDVEPLRKWLLDL